MSSLTIMSSLLQFSTCRSVRVGGSAIGNHSQDGTDCAVKAGDLNDPSKRRRKDTVLCLDGGGIKGLILTELLLALEESSGKKITDMFDWIVGTSTGGFLAIGSITRSV